MDLEQYYCQLDIFAQMKRKKISAVCTFQSSTLWFYQKLMNTLVRTYNGVFGTGTFSGCIFLYHSWAKPTNDPTSYF